jgi:hypothetical protein
MRVLGDLIGDRSHQQPGESARTARAQDDHVGVAGRFDELFDRETVNGIAVSYCL